jgi:hypothetical protein
MVTFWSRFGAFPTLLAVVVACLHPAPARAEAANGHKSEAWWAVNAGSAAALLIATALLPAKPSHPKNATLSAAADATYVLEAMLPVPVFLSLGNEGTTPEAIGAYGQGVIAVGTLGAVARHYDFGARSYVAFGAAVNSGLLVSERDRVGVGLSAGFWGVQLALATFSTHFHAKSYGTPFWKQSIGALLGTGAAVGVYALEAECWREACFGVERDDLYGLFGMIPGIVIPLFVSDEVARDVVRFPISPRRFAGGGFGLQLGSAF